MRKDEATDRGRTRGGRQGVRHRHVNFTLDFENGETRGGLEELRKGIRDPVGPGVDAGLVSGWNMDCDGGHDGMTFVGDVACCWRRY